MNRAKYPLSLISHLCERVGGRKLLGYDIGCAFSRTLQTTSLKNTFEGTCTVPAMHGYAHNKRCQLSFHPINTIGAGLEDFETCERFFSSSNNCAALTRHASTFHRLQFLDLHFRHTDSEKYGNLGKFIYNNYRQALKTISEETAILKVYGDATAVDGTVFERWRKEEKAYLDSLRSEPTEDKLSCIYVDAYEAWKAAE
jgi:KDZ transposase-like protein